MSAESTDYERFIQRARKGVAWGFGLSGLGLVVSTHLHSGAAAAVFGLVTFSCLVLVVLLVLEQLFAAWFASRRGSFSLAALLLFTAAAGVFFAILRSSIALALLLLAGALTVLSAALEQKRQPPPNPSSQAPTSPFAPADPPAGARGDRETESPPDDCCGR